MKVLMKRGVQNLNKFFQYVKALDMNGGKAGFAALFLGVGVILVGLMTDLPGGRVHHATASTATTSVTVLNTPPVWTFEAKEAPGSSTTTPTNSGSAVTWEAVGTDSSGDRYYLIICKTGSVPTPASNAAPTCSGGIGNQWAISASSTSGSTTYAATTTTEAFAESNAWFAWICDGNTANPACNTDYTQGTTTGTTSSPFNVNHRPTFTAFADYSPADPGAVVLWGASSTDSDVTGVADTVSLFVCKLADFTGSACGAGGTWCSAVASSSNPYCNFTLENPKPDGTYVSTGYIVDSHGHSASGGQQAVDSVLTVSNVTPTISSSSVNLLDSDGVGNLTLVTAGGQTTGFQITYTVSDANSCTTTANTAEITGAVFSAYRSGVGSTTCDTAGEYNPNNCYPSAVGTGIMNYTCTQNTGTCSGISDATTDWTCLFPMYFLAEATDGIGSTTDSPYWAQNWLATVQAGDNNYATSTIVETPTANGNELQLFLAYDVSTSTIPYGGLQPGQAPGALAVATDLRAQGNVGLDQGLYGTDMCPGYPTTACSGNATSTIFVNNQVYATSTVAYASGVTLLATPGAELEINVKKSTTTSTFATLNTYWGIQVPIAITLAGDYYGRNTLIGITGESANW